jgi:endogenous inhibitor of DNA gyrase (YacG/DUF329 family)
VRFICPTCRRTLEGTRAQHPELPFCSPRCKSIDLGSWLSESFRISSPAAEEDLDEGFPTGGGATPLAPEKN